MSVEPYMAMLLEIKNITSDISAAQKAIRQEVESLAVRVDALEVKARRLKREQTKTVRSKGVR